MDNPVEAAADLLDGGEPSKALALLDPLMAAGRLGPLGQLLRGQALAAAGRAAEAVAALREVVSLDRRWPDAAVAFGRALAANGALPTAIAEFQRALRIDPDHGPAHAALAQVWAAAGEPEKAEAHIAPATAAGYDLAELAAEIARMKSQARSSAGFVRALFDQFSADYDERMRAKLGYRAPEILAELGAAVSGGALARAPTLDLGCGTGLAAPAFAPAANGFVGVDLSGEMLKQAARHPYTELVEADIEDWLAATPRRFGRVVAADVFVYLGDLARVFAAVRRVLEPNGLFLFTVERHGGAADFVQLPTKRWAHAEPYLRRLAHETGFDVRGLVACTPRWNKGEPIPGLAGSPSRPDARRRCIVENRFGLRDYRSRRSRNVMPMTASPGSVLASCIAPRPRPRRSRAHLVARLYGVAADGTSRCSCSTAQSCSSRSSPVCVLRGLRARRAARGAALVAGRVDDRLPRGLSGGGRAPGAAADDRDRRRGRLARARLRRVARAGGGRAMTTRRVVMLGFPRVQILDVTGPLEILAAANELGLEPAPYAIELVAKDAGEMTTTAGLSLIAHRSFRDLGDADLASVHTFMVAGGDGTLDVLSDRETIGFVRRAGEAAQRVASVCSGSAILARAGLLDGRRATTHWGSVEAMAKAFPKVRMEPDPIYVRDGKFWTSAGVTAGMDLAVALVEADLGREIALSIARRHVLYMMRPGGQSQFSAELTAQGAPQGRTARAVRYALANLSADLSLPALAEAAGLSPRSLQRAFAEELGVSPAAFVARARLDAARRKLSAVRAPLERVAAQCGFPSAEIMRRTFQRELNVSPSDYRARFATSRRSP